MVSKHYGLHVFCVCDEKGMGWDGATGLEYLLVCSLLCVCRKDKHVFLGLNSNELDYAHVAYYWATVFKKNIIRLLHNYLVIYVFLHTCNIERHYNILKVEIFPVRKGFDFP